MATRTKIRFSREEVVRLWLDRQGLLKPRGRRLTQPAFIDHLERTGGLQLDSVNAVARAHYLTLWSRFATYPRNKIDAWAGLERVAYEFWGHEACILPPSHLPRSRRYMRDFNPSGKWWQERSGVPSVRRRVLKRIREEGGLESAHFKSPPGASAAWWGWKQEKIALEYLWRKGRLAVSHRRHFRRVYELAERVYPDGPVASRRDHEDGWLHIGLSGNGVASAKHLENYFTAPRLKAAERCAVIKRNLRNKRIVEVEVEGFAEPFYASAETVETRRRLPPPRGTNLICPFDSLLWQRERAENLLGFRYRIEIYVPREKRVFGYYVLPILHEGRLVGRLDPKNERDGGRLLINAIHLEPGFKPTPEFRRGLGESLADLARFLRADKVVTPRGWRDLL